VRTSFCVALLFLGLLSTAPTAAEGRTPVGVWLHANGRIWIEIAPCGDRLCGKLVWFKWPNDAQGLPLVDLKNANPALRSRPLLGLTILQGLRRTGEGTWEEGRIYNPDDGVDYRALVSIAGDGTLRVRAYVLVPLLGKSFIWTRVRLDPVHVATSQYRPQEIQPMARRRRAAAISLRSRSAAAADRDSRRRIRRVS
jgi:uncharacterized protein (DUF2147 family)